MTDQFAQIQSAVVAKLQALTKPKYVYAYEKGNIAGYPAITLYLAEYIAEWATTQHDEETFIFTIHIYQEMENKAVSEAETILDSALTETMQAFQADYTLGGKIDKMSVRASKGWTSREVTDRVAVVTLTCKKLNSIV